MLNVVVQTSITEMMQLLQMHHVVDDVIDVLPDNGTIRPNVLSPALCELDRVCYTIPYSHIGLMNNICNYCAAKKFSKESQGLCCKKGAINLPQVNRLPDELYNLYENNPHFKDQVRKYNSAFAFTSLGVNVDTQLANNNHGIYTFRIQGQLYHQIGSLTPMNDDPAKFAQIYFYDSQAQNERRLQIFPTLDPFVCNTIGDLLHRINPYVMQFKHLREIQAPEICLQLKANSSMDLRRYNLPTADDVAVLIIDNENVTNRREIILRHRDNSLKKISELSKHYDPLQYPLLFPHGESGWTPNFMNTRGRRVTQLQWTSFYLQLRTEDPRNHPIHLGGKLFQQFIVDQYSKIETGRLNYFRTHQREIRSELYQGLQDAFANDNERVGRRIVLPSSFTAGPRAMLQLYQDSMAIVREFGKPDLFITVTCNPSWPEIKDNLMLNQTAQDRPDIVARVFNQKLKLIIQDLTKNNIFGKVIAFMYVVEFQKRGLPHAHILLILDESSKPRDPMDFDKFVSAEIPDRETQPELYDLVATHMVHGPCGHINPRSPCMSQTDPHRPPTCTKAYPKPFAPRTTKCDNGYPIYRRRQNNREIKKVINRREVSINNQWIVPYNPYLLMKYQCHTNIEICSSVKSVKYLNKYVYKGHDRSSLAVGSVETIDEISNYVDARYVSACEAAWRIFEFNLHGHSHAIYRLPVHLEDNQLVTFQDSESLENILERGRCTKLTEYFNVCQHDEFAKQLTYVDFPKHYVWIKNSWRRRRRSQNVIPRLYSVSPSESERFHLRMLLHTVKGATSFSFLRTFNGITYETYKGAAAARGLIDDNREYSQCLEEATHYAMPRQLRQLFVTILTFGSPQNISELWNAHKHALSEDFDHLPDNDRFNKAAKAIRELLSFQGKLYHTIPGLPHIYDDHADEHIDDAFNDNNLIADELNYSAEEIDAGLQNIERLNAQQQAVFDHVTNLVLNGGDQKSCFVDGPGGSGKTFLYTAILAYLRSKGKIVLAVASSGIAAYLLQGGRTAHYQFKIPLTLDAHATCNIPVQGRLADLLRSTSLIVWDEIPMCHRYAIETVERSLRDVRNCNELFGGVPVLFGGDFRQILPVVLRGSRQDIVAATLQHSYIWPQLYRFHLTSNNRALNNDFANYLIEIGEGRRSNNAENLMMLPREIVIENNNMDTFINTVFPDLHQNLSNTEYLTERAILTPKNSDVDFINHKIGESIQGFSKTYYSADSVEDEEEARLFPTEFLNSLTVNGLPAHKLVLKIGMPIILLRNLDPSQGLCNGTRLIIRGLGANLIDAEIALGKFKGHRVFIPRIVLSPSQTTLPFVLRRKQFPVRLCFAMTINKAQGQTLKKVGIFLPGPVFTHGQLYVALSRARYMNDISVLNYSNQNPLQVTNVVYREILT